MAKAAHDDMYAPEVQADPYPYYARLREEDPVHWNAMYETWLVTRYEDVVWVIRHPELFSSESVQRDPRPPAPPIRPEDAGDYEFVKAYRNYDLIRHDDPTHQRMRKAINRPFTPKAVEDLRAMVKGVVNDLLDQVAAKGGMDVVSDIAQPLPLRVISRLLGIPEEDRELVRDQAARRMASDISLLPNRMKLSAQGFKETAVYLTPLVEERLKHPQGDLLSLLAHAEKTGTYSRDEALVNGMGLIDAGHETTIKLLCNGMLAFLRHPDQWEMLKKDPSLAASATEECLRFEPPLVHIRRIAARDVELRGKAIKKDDRVHWIIASANRDPRVFKDPDTFDITRSPNHHLSFGSGVHYCLGQYLARIEGQEVFTSVAERFPRMRLAGPVEFEPTKRARAMKSLRIEWN